MSSEIKALPPIRTVEVQGESLTIRPFKFVQLEAVGKQFEAVMAIAERLGREARGKFLARTEKEINFDNEERIRAVAALSIEAGKSEEEVRADIDAAVALAQGVPDIPMQTLMLAAAGPIVSLCRSATNKGEAFFETLDIDEGIALAAAVFAVNKEQYGGKKFSEGLAKVMRALGATAKP